MIIKETVLVGRILMFRIMGMVVILIGLPSRALENTVGIGMLRCLAVASSNHLLAGSESMRAENIETLHVYFQVCI